jgi:hypothetical protein
MNRQPHPDGAKAQARQVYEAHGSRKASEVTGLPRRTVNAWAKAEGWQRRGQRPDLRVAPVAETRQPAGKRSVPAGYSLARRVLLRRLGDTAGLALDQVEAELRQGHTSKARDCAIICGIALDKAELLAKAAGAGVGGDMPTVEEARTRLRELAIDLTARRTGSDGRPQ